MMAKIRRRNEPVLPQTKVANAYTVSNISLPEAVRLFDGGDTRSLILTGVYLQHMAHDAGIDAPLEALRRFADLIRADQKVEGLERRIRADAAMIEHLPARRAVPYPRPVDAPPQHKKHHVTSSERETMSRAQIKRYMLEREAKARASLAPRPAIADDTATRPPSP
jgi:hypothetical protein